MTEDTEPNAAQIAYWNADMGTRWLALQDEIDVMFATISAALLALAAPRPGEHVVEIGCGSGSLVTALADRVGPGGSVLGVDVSAVMLDRAAARIAGLPQARVVEADAARHSFAAMHDLVFSRFGVMFFDDPVAAFTNIRTALAPGGRLAMAVWRGLAENAWMNVPLAAALPHLPPQPPAEPGAPGPFAFADPDRVRAILTQAGFADIVLASLDPPIPMAGPGGLERAAARALLLGPVARALTDEGPDTRVAVAAAIREDFGRRGTADGLVLGGAIWLIAARA